MENTSNSRIKDVRKHLRLTQKEMAEMLSVQQSYYSEVENGKRSITSKIVEKLKNRTGISSDWIYSGSGPMFITNSEDLSFPRITSLSKEDQKIVQSIRERSLERMVIGPIRKNAFITSLSKEDQKLIQSVRELPELLDLVGIFTKSYDLDTLEKLSTIGVVWIAGMENVGKQTISADADADAYESNMRAFIDSLSKHKKQIIAFRGQLLAFAKEVQPLLDSINKYKLPAE